MGRLTRVVSVSAGAVVEAEFRYDRAGNRISRIIGLGQDSDGDGMPDHWENQYPFLNPYNSSDALQDYDADGLNNSDEYINGTD